MPETAGRAEPGSPEWVADRAPVKPTIFARIGMVDGEADARRPARHRRGYDPGFAHSWMYRRGFARAFLVTRWEERHG